MGMFVCCVSIPSHLPIRLQPYPVLQVVNTYTYIYIYTSKYIYISHLLRIIESDEEFLVEISKEGKLNPLGSTQRFLDIRENQYWAIGKRSTAFFAGNVGPRV